jgi:hypothetical protein
MLPQVVKDSPQPHAPFELGLLNTNSALHSPGSNTSDQGIYQIETQAWSTCACPAAARHWHWRIAACWAAVRT